MIELWLFFPLLYTWNIAFTERACPNNTACIELHIKYENPIKNMVNKKLPTFRQYSKMWMKLWTCCQTCVEQTMDTLMNWRNNFVCNFLWNIFEWIHWWFVIRLLYSIQMWKVCILREEVSRSNSNLWLSFRYK